MARKTGGQTPAGEKLYRSISEVSELLDVKPHVLRYWETQFSVLGRARTARGTACTVRRRSSSCYTSRSCSTTAATRSPARRKSLNAEKKAAHAQVDIGFEDAGHKVMLERGPATS